MKTAKSSLAMGHMGGGPTGGTQSWDLGPLPWVMGFIYKKKILQDPGANTHTAATIRKEVLTPPQPPQKGYPDMGWYGGQNPKKYWEIIFGPKMMILQGVCRQKPYLGVCYVNDPQKGGYTTPAPALQPRFEVISNCSFGPLCSPISEPRLVLRLPLYKGSVPGAPFPTTLG